MTDPIAQPPASLYIDGAYAEGQGAAFDSRFPFDGEVIARLRAASPEQVAQACMRAEAAQPAWAALAPVERGRVLQRAAALIRARNEALSKLETLDTGKPIQETLVADWESGAQALEYFGGLIANVAGQHLPLGADWAYTRREALGVCAGIGAWNYPSQIACWKAAPALAMGNAMVFKPSEETPLGALKLAEILTEAGLPEGVFNVVQGGAEVGAALISDPRIAKVSLTGSVSTGRKVYEAAARGLRHVTMELGGKSPLIVFEDADLDTAISAAILANFYSSGQVCSNGTRVFVHDTLHEAFLDGLKRRLEGVVTGDPRDPKVNHGPIISPAQAERIRGFISRAQASAARMVCGGVGEGAFIPPTVFADLDDDAEIVREEVFGPVMSVLRFTDEADVIARANASDYGLAAGVITRDLARGHRVVAALEAGTCWINSYNLTPVEMPFGGVKASGIGRENGLAALDHYSCVKSVYVAMSPVEAPY